MPKLLEHLKSLKMLTLTHIESVAQSLYDVNVLTHTVLCIFSDDTRVGEWNKQAFLI